MLKLSSKTGEGLQEFFEFLATRWAEQRHAVADQAACVQEASFSFESLRPGGARLPKAVSSWWTAGCNQFFPPKAAENTALSAANVLSNSLFC